MFGLIEKYKTAAIGFFAALFWLNTGTTDSSKLTPEEYAINNLRNIMMTQEAYLDIKHFDFPKLTFEKDNDYLGTYCQQSDTINIYPEQHYVFPRPVNLNGKMDVTATLWHELGHFYADKLAERMKLGNWPSYPDNPVSRINDPKDKSIGTKLVSEGIAEYFERCYTKQEDDFSGKWPEDLSIYHNRNYKKEPRKLFNCYIIYPLGYHFVKPVIDSYGKDGIKYLIQHPPINKDLENPQKYQRQILSELAFEKFKQSRLFSVFFKK